jgi:hypothetical protein
LIFFSAKEAVWPLRTSDTGILKMGQGCQMALFQTKNPKLGKFWRFLQWKMLVYFTATWSIFLPFGIFWGHLVFLVLNSYRYFLVIWYFSPFWYVVSKNLATLHTRSSSTARPKLGRSVTEKLHLAQIELARASPRFHCF